jgi:diaminopimelate decarboxylase
MEKIYKKCDEFILDIPTVIIEPGRWVIGEAGITLYTIGSIKEIPDIRTYVSVDGGIPDNPRPALYGAKYDAVIANKADEEKNKVVTISGKCCETGDILIWNLKVPEVESGDILAVFSTGAYNYSMSNNYNRIPRPAVVLVNEGNAEIIVERETYDDLIRKDRVPEYLR